MRRRSFAPGAFYNGAGVRCCHVNQVPAIYQTRFISPHVRLICYVRPRFTHRRRRRRPHEEDACISFKVDYAPLCIELHNCFPRSCNSFEANGLHLFYFLLLHNTVFAKLFRNFISFYPVKGFLHIYEIDKHLCNFINSNTNGFSGIPSTMYYSYNDNRANSVQAIVNLLTNYFLLVYSTDKTCNTSFSVWCDIIDIKQI